MKELDLSGNHDKFVANVIDGLTQLKNKTVKGRDTLILFEENKDATEIDKSSYIDDFNSKVDNIIMKLRQSGLNLGRDINPNI